MKLSAELKLDYDGSSSVPCIDSSHDLILLWQFGDPSFTVVWNYVKCEATIWDGCIDKDFCIRVYLFDDDAYYLVTDNGKLLQWKIDRAELQPLLGTALDCAKPQHRPPLSILDTRVEHQSNTMSDIGSARYWAILEEEPEVEEDEDSEQEYVPPRCNLKVFRVSSDCPPTPAGLCLSINVVSRPSGYVSVRFMEDNTVLFLTDRSDLDQGCLVIPKFTSLSPERFSDLKLEWQYPFSSKRLSEKSDGRPISLYRVGAEVLVVARQEFGPGVFAARWGSVERMQ